MLQFLIVRSPINPIFPLPEVNDEIRGLESLIVRDRGLRLFRIPGSMGHL